MIKREEREMTTLNGSEKQIAWATEIRDTFLNGIVRQGFCVDKGVNQHIEFKQSQIDSDIEELKTVSDESEITEITEEIEMYKRTLELFNYLKYKLESESSAAWFIDNRMNNHSLFCKEVFNK